jgi:hypothetical protein
MTVLPHPPTSPDLAPCNFSLLYTTILIEFEVIEAESQVMLNTLREYDFHDAFKK